MATLTFSFDTGSVPLSRIVDGIAKVYGYQTTIPDPNNPGQTIPNPETKAEFGRKQVRKFIVDAVKKAEVMQAIEAAQQAESNVSAIDLT